MLLYDEALGHASRERLLILRDTDDGFAIADADFRLRGGGEALGTRQSGAPVFRLGLEDLGLEPHEVAMVGDDAEADVAGAQAAGLNGVQVKTGKYLPGAKGAPDLLLDSFARLPEMLGSEASGFRH